MATSSVQTVPTDVIRVNLDGTSLAPFRKAWQLYEQANGLSGATAPVAIASATWAAGLTVVTVFDGEKEIAYYCGENTGVGQATFNYWKNTFVPRTTFGNPGTNGYVLSSTTGGTRSWVAQSGGGAGVTSIAGQTGVVTEDEARTALHIHDGLSHLTEGEPIFIVAIGDSNMTGGSSAPSTAPVYNPNVFLRMMPTLTATYVEADIEWGAIDPNDPSRSLQATDAYGDLKTPTMHGLGSSNTASYSAASALQVATGRDVYLYINAQGLMPTTVWAPPSGAGWNGYDAVFNAANNASVAAAIADMNTITGGSKVFADVVIVSLGANDLHFNHTSGPAWYTIWRSVFDAMIDAGWYDVNYSQYFHIENVNNNQADILAEYTPGWSGYNLMLANTNERVRLVSSMGAQVIDDTNLHYVGDQYVAFGNSVAEMTLIGPPLKPAVRPNTYIEKLLPFLGGTLQTEGYGFNSSIADGSGVNAFTFDTTNPITTGKSVAFKNDGTLFAMLSNPSGSLAVWEGNATGVLSIRPSSNALYTASRWDHSVLIGFGTQTWHDAGSWQFETHTASGTTGFRFKTTNTFSAGNIIEVFNNASSMAALDYTGKLTLTGAFQATTLTATTGFSGSAMSSPATTTGGVDTAFTFSTVNDFSTSGDMLYVWKNQSNNALILYGDGSISSIVTGSGTVRFRTGLFGSITVMNEPIQYGTSVTSFTSSIAASGSATAFNYNTAALGGGDSLAKWSNNSTLKVSFSSTGLPGFFGVAAPAAQTTSGARVGVTAAGSTNAVYRDTKFGESGTGYTVGDIVACLKAHGYFAA